MVKRKPVNTYGFFDTETYHIEDMHSDHIDVRIVGNSPHVFVNGHDTGEKPRTWVKCASLITVDADTRKENRYYLDTAEDILSALVDHRVDRAYAHNYRFDGSFIISYLFEGNNYIQLPNGWTVTHKHSVMGKRGIIYEDELVYTKMKRNPKTHRHDVFIVRLRDSAKIWNSSVRELGRSFGLIKGDEALSIGVTDEIRAYCMQDSEIIKTAIMWYIDKVRELTNGEVVDGYMTAASTAYKLAMYWLQHGGVKTAPDMDKKQFDLFKKTYLPEVCEHNGFPDWMRKLYKGATPLLNKRKIKKIVRLLRVYDVNSMYPYQLAKKKMPIGFPKRWEHPNDIIKENVKLWFGKAQLVAKVKAGHRATYLDKSKPDTLIDNPDYMGTAGEDSFVYLTNIDFQTLIRDYDIEYLNFVDAYTIGSFVGLFNGFIEYWYDIKKNTKDKAMRAFAKLIINSLYGKFGTREEQESCEYLMDEDKCLHVQECEEINETFEHFYLPIAIWTTSYARDLISKACNILGWDHVVYTDTDSLHIINLTKAECERRLHEAGIGTTETELGDFKDETKEALIDGIYIRNKGYFHFWATEGWDKDMRFHYKGDVQEIKMGGANEFPNIHNIWDVYNRKLKFIQRRGYRVPGGTLIMEKEVEVKDTDDDLKFILKKKGMTEKQTRRYFDNDIMIHGV